MQHFLSTWGYLALAVLTFAEAACVPIPSEITLGFAGYLAFTHKLEIVLVIVIGALGELCGSFVGYAIGRYGGRPFVDKVGRYLLISNLDLDRSEAWFARRGEPAVFFGRILPIIRTFISIPAGMAEMRLRRFAAATLAGSLVWCTALAVVGYELGSRWHSITKGFSAAGYVLIAVVVIAFVLLVVHRLHTL
ncbi:MAG: DedA family protein, partial [Acidimicrobiales bacterium]